MSKHERIIVRVYGSWPRQEDLEYMGTIEKAAKSIEKQMRGAYAYVIGSSAFTQSPKGAKFDVITNSMDFALSFSKSLNGKYRTEIVRDKEEAA